MENQQSLFKIFTRSFLQILFVVMNGYFIAQSKIVGVAICSYIISMLWAMNVRSMALSSTTQRHTYASGAMAGAITGFYIAKYLSS